MGFALELANAGNSGLPDAWETLSAAPRHRRPLRRRRFRPARLLHATAAAFAAAARRARTVITTRPAIADHRRAF